MDEDHYHCFTEMMGINMQFDWLTDAMCRIKIAHVGFPFRHQIVSDLTVKFAYCHSNSSDTTLSYAGV